MSSVDEVGSCATETGCEEGNVLLTRFLHCFIEFVNNDELSQATV